MGTAITFPVASQPIEDQIVDRLLPGIAVEADVRRFVDRDPELIVFMLLAFQVRFLRKLLDFARSQLRRTGSVTMGLSRYLLS